MYCLIFRRLKSTLSTRVKDLVSKRLYNQALSLYREDLHSSRGVHAADTSLLPSLIKACASPQTHDVGLQLHSIIIKSGSDFDLAVPNSLISMYAKSDFIGHARKLFDEMPQRDTISYGTLINWYVENGCLGEAMFWLKEMHRDGFVSKPELIASIISLCTKTGNCKLGRAIHGLIIVDERVLEESAFILSALVDFYMKFHDTTMASRVFCVMEPNAEVVSWTAMISGWISNGKHGKGICYMRRMLSQGHKPNQVTLLSILPAFSEMGSLKHGKQIHSYAIRHGFDLHHRLAVALVDFYGKCAKHHYARTIFKQSREKDVVMWSSIIRIHVQGRIHGEALKLFRQMRVQEVEPNSVTLLAIISCCASLCSLSNGCTIHGYVLSSGMNSDLFVGNALINMYSKFGCLMDSHQIFREMAVKDTVSWSALISGYGLHGHGKEALKLFDEMQERNLQVDGIAWLAVLSACNHSGLLEEGEKLFKRAREGDAIGIEHYACYVDLLGRLGEVEKACDVVRTMPMKPSEKIWSSLVSACKARGRFEIAENLVEEMIKSDPGNAANYTLLSMIRADSGNWAAVEKIRRLARVQGVRKRYGFSRIEVETTR